MLSPADRKLAGLKVKTHQHIQPAPRGLDKEYELLTDSAYAVQQASNKFSVDPFGMLAGGWQIANDTRPLGEISAGAVLHFETGKKFYADAGFSYNVLSAPQYIEKFEQSARVLPGVDYAYTSQGNLLASPYSFGRVSYQAGKYFNFEIGKGKNFMGDGYRSLIISDLSATYPYARIITKIGKIQYTNLWAQMRDLSLDNNIRNVRRKYIALHSLSYNINSKVNLTVYEMVVWQNSDRQSERSLDIHYLNPIIFYRPVEYAQGSADNVLLAASLRVKASKKVQLYGQLLLDEFNLKQLRSNAKWWADKFGGQLGFKVLKTKIPGLTFQSEMNAVRPFTYSHGSPVQSWTNLNQPLAHPLGANFLEWINFVRYEKNKWVFLEQINWAGYGRDKDMDNDGNIDNLGGDIFKSYRKPFRIYANVLMQGNKSTFLFHQLTVSRKILKDDQLEIFMTHCLRNERSETGHSFDHFLMFGIRTAGLMTPRRDF